MMAPERLKELAERALSEGGVRKVDYYERGKDPSPLSGGESVAGFARSRERYVMVPKPLGIWEVYITAHEAAHVFYQHDGSKPKYIKEYEAETWAFAFLERHRIDIPETFRHRARKYIRESFVKDLWRLRRPGRLGRIPPEVTEFCGESFGGIISWYVRENRLRVWVG